MPTGTAALIQTLLLLQSLHLLQKLHRLLKLLLLQQNSSVIGIFGLNLLCEGTNFDSSSPLQARMTELLGF